ncbi:MAG: hypothetical protein N2037_00600 [Acidimicrobiales bacterium]|nr:hypothetical protein [Acidimicrobiales bacterium]
MLVTLLGACSAQNRPLSQWVAKADAVCARSQDEAELVRPVVFPRSMLDILRLSSELSKKEASDLRDLEKPTERRQEVRDYLGTLDERNRALDLLVSATEQASPDAEVQTGELVRLTQQAVDQAQRLGLQKCRAGVDLSVGGPPTTFVPQDGGVPLGPVQPGVPGAEVEIGTQDGAGDE